MEESAGVLACAASRALQRSDRGDGGGDEWHRGGCRVVELAERSLPPSGDRGDRPWPRAGGLAHPLAPSGPRLDPGSVCRVCGTAAFAGAPGSPGRSTSATAKRSACAATPSAFPRPPPTAGAPRPRSSLRLPASGDAPPPNPGRARSRPPTRSGLPSSSARLGLSANDGTGVRTLCANLLAFVANDHAGRAAARRFSRNSQTVLDISQNRLPNRTPSSSSSSPPPPGRCACAEPVRVVCSPSLLAAASERR